MTTNIKKLLKLNTYLVLRLIKLKIKYENTFIEKLTMYD